MKIKIRKYMERGSALLLTLLCMALLSVISMGLVGLSTTQNKMSQNHYDSVKSLFLARAGIVRAKIQLSADPTWAVSTPYTENMAVNGEAGKFNVSVTPFTTNGTGSVKRWYVTSIGSISGAKRKITAILESETTGGHYVILYDYPAFLWGGTDTVDRISGPIHSNGYFVFSGKPEFDAAVTSTNRWDSYYSQKQNTYTQGGTTYTDPSKFYHYTSNYEDDQPVGAPSSTNFSFKGGQPEVSFPNNINEQINSATYSYNGDISVVFLAGGGMEVTSKSGTETLPTNGVSVYTNKNIYVKGTVNGEVTLLTNSNTYIQDNLVYKNKAVDFLTIISKRDVLLNTNRNDVRDIEVDAMIYALMGSFSVNDYNRGSPRGKINLFGGIAAKYQGATGTYYMSGKLRSGYAKNYVFDEKLKTKSSLSSPTTGEVVLKTWKDNAALE